MWRKITLLAFAAKCGGFGRTACRIITRKVLSENVPQPRIKFRWQAPEPHSTFFQKGLRVYACIVLMNSLINRGIRILFAHELIFGETHQGQNRICNKFSTQLFFGSWCGFSLQIPLQMFYLFKLCKCCWYNFVSDCSFVQEFFKYTYSYPRANGCARLLLLAILLRSGRKVYVHRIIQLPMPAMRICEDTRGYKREWRCVEGDHEGIRTIFSRCIHRYYIWF